MKKDSYEHLAQVLDKHTLFITDLVFDRTKEERYIFKGSIKARLHNDMPHIKDGAMHRGIHVVADSADGVVEKLWHVVRNKELWIGTYNNYSKVLKWHDEAGKLVARELTRSEKIAQEVDTIV